MPCDCGAQPFLARRTGRANRRQDAAARRVQLLVARAACAKGELLDAIAREARMGVAVHEAWDGAGATAVHLDDLTLESRQVAHGADGLDAAVRAEHEAVLDDVHAAERASTKRRDAAGRGRDLGEIVNEQTGQGCDLLPAAGRQGHAG